MLKIPGRMGTLWIALFAVLVSCNQEEVEVREEQPDPSSAGAPGRVLQIRAQPEPRTTVVNCPGGQSGNSQTWTIPAQQGGVLPYRVANREHLLIVHRVSQSTDVTMEGVAGSETGVRVTANPAFPADSIWGILVLDFSGCQPADLPSVSPAKKLPTELLTLPVSLDSVREKAVGFVWGASEYILASN